MQRKKIIEPGKWYSECDGNGNDLFVQYDAAYLKLLGLDSEEEFAASGLDWRHRIHPEDQERIIAHAEWIRQKHPENPPYDIEYRMMTKDGVSLVPRLCGLLAARGRVSGWLHRSHLRYSGYGGQRSDTAYARREYRAIFCAGGRF